MLQVNRLHSGELERQRELHRAASAARERQFERELEDAAALHKAQLAAYDKIESQGGTLHKLASEVKDSAEALGILRDKMDTELWKGVLKAEVRSSSKQAAASSIHAHTYHHSSHNPPLHSLHMHTGVARREGEKPQ